MAWQRTPVGLLETVIEMRTFAAAKRVVDNAKSRAEIPREPIYQTVFEIEFAIAEMEGQAPNDATA